MSGKVSTTRITGFFTALFGIGILWEGRHLTRGTLGHPGPGYFPSLLAILLIFFSLFLIIPKGKKEGEPLPSWSTIYKQLIPIYAALMAFVGLLKFFGFIILTLLLMFFLFVKASHFRWYTALSAAFISAGITYLIFEVVLKSSFPKGPFGF